MSSPPYTVGRVRSGPGDFATHVARVAGPECADRLGARKTGGAAGHHRPGANAGRPEPDSTGETAGEKPGCRRTVLVFQFKIQYELGRRLELPFQPIEFRKKPSLTRTLRVDDSMFRLESIRYTD